MPLTHSLTQSVFERSSVQKQPAPTALELKGRLKRKRTTIPVTSLRAFNCMLLLLLLFLLFPLIPAALQNAVCLIFDKHLFDSDGSRCLCSENPRQQKPRTVF